MSNNLEHLADLIFKKLKTYKNKKIFLDKENLDGFITSLFKENWTQDLIPVIAIVKLILINKYMYNFSSLTITLTIIFIVSLYLLFRVTSGTKN